MRLSSELYKGVLEELDKYNSPSFPLSSFYYFMNKSRLEYCNEKYKLTEVTQQITDDIQVIKRSIVTSSNTINLVTSNLINAAPALTVDISAIDGTTPFTNNLNAITAYNNFNNYFHATLGKLTYTFTAPYKCYGIGDVLTFPVKKITDDKEGFILESHYFKPKWDRPYFKIENNIVTLLNGNVGSLPPATMQFQFNYLKHPKIIVLGTDASGNIYSGWDILSEFVDYVDNECIKICVKLFLENIEQKRLNTNIPLNQIN